MKGIGVKGLTFPPHTLPQALPKPRDLAAGSGEVAAGSGGLAAGSGEPTARPVQLPGDDFSADGGGNGFDAGGNCGDCSNGAAPAVDWSDVWRHALTDVEVYTFTNP